MTFDNGELFYAIASISILIYRVLLISIKAPDIYLNFCRAKIVPAIWSSTDIDTLCHMEHIPPENDLNILKNQSEKTYLFYGEYDVYSRPFQLNIHNETFLFDWWVLCPLVMSRWVFMITLLCRNMSLRPCYWCHQTLAKDPLAIGDVDISAITGTIILVPYRYPKSL